MAASSNRQTLEQKQRLGLRLGQEQVHYVRMLEMTDAEVMQDLRRELDENPALELANPQPPETNDSIPGPSWLPAPLSNAQTHNSPFVQSGTSTESLYEAVIRQLDTLELPKPVLSAARYIAGNLDSNGYLHRSLEQIATDMLLADNQEPSLNEMEQALTAVQNLDPAGVGATDLRQSLLLQLKRLDKSEAVDDATLIVSKHFAKLGTRRFSQLKAAVGGDSARLDAALEVIHRLNPKPGASYASSRELTGYVTPDFEVDVHGEDIRISLTGGVPELAISQSFATAVADMERHRRQGRDPYVMSRYNDAREYMRILERRRRTMMDVMTAIVDLQRPYILSDGDESLLRPMALKDVAARTGMDISVISRAIRNRYVALPWATLPVRFFFSESFESGTGGEGISGRSVEQAIRNVVAKEDHHHPLSDDAICQLLREQGFDVSRRTVSKYRDRLNIPVARLRAEH